VVLLDSIIILVAGIREKKITLIIPAAIVLLLSLAGLLIFKVLHGIQLPQQLGVASLTVGIIFLAVVALTMLLSKRTAWWAIIPGSLFLAAGICLIAGRDLYFSLVLYLPLGLGIAFMAWGLRANLFGLTIPGALLIGIGPGIYLGWHKQLEESASASLTSTGIMLVCFALSWGLVILSYRVLKQKFIWWPIIPAGVLFVTGLGLFLGGHPSSSVSFFSNAGSIGLIIIGIYLMLMRREVKK